MTEEAGTSQRDRLLARKRPAVPYRLLIDGDAVGAARMALLAAQRDLRQARLQVGKGRAAAVRRAEAAVADAEQAVDACYETVVLHALAPRDLEALIAEHPPTAAQWAAVQKARDEAAERDGPAPAWPDWDDDTFYPALLAACATEAGMSPADWAAFLEANASNGEVVGIRHAALNVNHRERVADPLVLPKDWMQMLS